jgi:ppGpp synthetase/RelA/SpoT-type nucleotidyltranferase
MTASYSKERIRRAGDLLRTVDANSPNELAEAVLLVDEWRAAHARPLKSINANLRYYVRKQKVEPRITQRLERFSTILDKLQREPRMMLSRMEDIAGVRVILPYQAQIDELVRDLESQPRWQIRRKREYIEGREGPKEDGYRAVHLVVARKATSSRSSCALPGKTPGPSRSSRTLVASVHGSSSVTDRTICDSTT